MFSRRLRNAYKSNVKSFNLVRNDCLLVPPVSGRRDLPAPGWQNAHVAGCFVLVRRVSQAKGSRSGWMASSQGCNSTLPPRRQWRPHERPQCSRALNSYLRATTRGSAAFIAKEASTKRRGQGAWHQGAPRLLRDASRSGPACRAAQGGKKKKLRCLGDGTKLSHVLKQHRSCHRLAQSTLHG